MVLENFTCWGLEDDGCGDSAADRSGGQDEYRDGEDQDTKAQDDLEDVEPILMKKNLITLNNFG